MAQLVQNTFISAPPKDLVLEQGFRFTHGETIAPFTIRYETFGELNDDRSNAILVCHALSASAHAAGKYTEAEEEHPGWWDGLVGYGKGIDLEKYFVVCVNLPGSCFGTTAPASIDPKSGRPYGSRYPWPLIEDMVHSQKFVLDHLGIKHLRSIAGGSLGGMQVLMWTALYPDFSDSIMAMACGAAVPVQGIAWMVGHMTYLSSAALQSKFGRRRRGNTRQFEIDSYFEYQGQKFAKQYDANSYIRVQAAMDEMDLSEQFGSLETAFAKWRSETLLVSFNTDWLFPVKEVDRVEAVMRANGTNIRHERIASTNGHDTFLIDYDLITPSVREFLAGL
jgi:homoserine O-acetyltransferase